MTLCAGVVGLCAPAFGSTGLDLSPQEPAPPAATATSSDPWKFTLKPYFWAAAISGDVDFNSLPSQDVDVSFSDIMDNFDIGGMLGFEAREGDSDVAFLGDLLYIDLEHDGTNADASMDMFMSEFDVTWRPWEPKWLEGLVGLRYWYVDVEVDPTGPPQASKSQDWVDPIIGARATAPWGERLVSQFRGDIGGFGVGTKSTWQLSGDIQYAFSTSLSATLGYRALNIDYEADRADYDLTLYGPWLGVNWSF